jgi:hypothetical protein
VETEDGYVPQDVTPTCDELSLFKNHPRIPPSTIKKAYNITSSLVLQHGDHVLISTGKFQGLSGIIISVDASYANVDIPLRGMTTMIECNHLQKDIQVGDQVKVLTGPNTNFTHWFRQPLFLQLGHNQSHLLGTHRPVPPVIIYRSFLFEASCVEF